MHTSQGRREKKGEKSCSDVDYNALSQQFMLEWLEDKCAPSRSELKPMQLQHGESMIPIVGCEKHETNICSFKLLAAETRL